MNYGIVVPFADPRLTLDLGREAEAAGWDGLFLPELVWGMDPWAQLAAVAAVTTRIRLGTMLSPLPWRPPWTLAGQVAAVDHLSGGRAILSVGLGAPDAGALGFPVPIGRRERAELLDEGLDVLEGLWSGEPFAYSSKHYTVDPTPFSTATRPEGMPPPPPPLQRPRVPIWVVGAWPSKKSMARALRYDGLIPAVPDSAGTRQASPTELAEIAAFVRDTRAPGAGAFDIVVDGETPPGRGQEIVAEWAAAGATWWTETRWTLPGTAEGIAQFRERVLAGPPRLP